MKSKTLDARTDLRRRAELTTLERKSGNAVPRTDLDSQRLLHELEVHQIELEMQNAELRLARDEAEAAREKYSDLYDFAPVGYFTILADGTIRMVNLAGATLVGMERSRLVGRSFLMLISPALRPTFSAFLAQLFSGNAAPWIESELVTKSQPDRFVTINKKLSPGGQECSLTVTDISARKRDEDALRMSEIRYRRLFEAAHDGVLLIDPATSKITDANPFMTKLLGYPHTKLVGKELFEIGLLKDEAASQEMFRKLKKNHEVRYENLPLESQGGRHQEVEVVANLYQENGRPVIQCNIRDITERKQAEDLLRRNEALVSALIGQVPTGIYVVDAGFRLQQANPVALKAFGSMDHPIGKDFAEIVRFLWPKRVAEETLVHFRHTLATGEPYRSPDFTHRRRDIGVKEFYEWQVERVTLPTGEFGVVCFFNDITARIQAEKAQLRLEVMAASNLKLKQEIVRRQKVEVKLHETEYVQSRLLEHSLQQQAQLRNMSHKILHAQEDERKRISRELHDVIAQTLAGINIHIAALAHKNSDNLGGLQQQIANTQHIVENSMKVIRQFALELRPTVLDDLGLIPALEAFLKDFTETSGIRVSLEISSCIEEASEDIRTTFFRIIQEALINVAQHSKASTVHISIQCLAEGTSLQITDDGQGFEMEEKIHPISSTRLGLLGMKERAEMVGGVFSVDTASGRPTTLRVMVGFHPIKETRNLAIGSPKRSRNSLK
jgi:PAS domain S-box-containing protein